MIRENDNIKGIVVNNVEHKITQYADDTEFTLAGDRKSFEECLNVLDVFGKKSGLIMNNEKTSAMWLGNVKNSSVKYMQHLNMIWNPPQIKVLGIWISNTLIDCVESNYMETIYEARKLFQIWSKRNITPLGRIAILKSLILSKLIQLWLLLPRPPENLLNELQKMCYNFVWNNKPDKICRKTAIKTIKNGGLGIPDLRKFISALKLTWLRKFKLSSHKWKNIFIEEYSYIDSINMYGPEIKNKYKIENPFWKEVFVDYYEFFYKVEALKLCDVLAEPVFFNKRIMVGKTAVTNEEWFQHGVYIIGHFVKEDGQYLTHIEFNNKYDLNVDFLTYNGCLLSIKKYVKTTGVEIVNNIANTDPLPMQIILSICKGSKSYYEILVKDVCKPKCCDKWNEKVGFDINWEECFKKIQRIKDVKMKWFQIRIVHRIIATNVMLKAMHVTDTELCSFCGREKDSIPHIFWHCGVVQNFWLAFERWIKEKCVNEYNLKMNESIVLFGVANNVAFDDVFDLIVVLAKQYIYSCRYNNTHPNLTGFKNKLSGRYKIERYNAMINQELIVFDVAWHCYKPLLL
jgi:hypothetical protein